jgi:hypothetical protein
MRYRDRLSRPGDASAVYALTHEAVNFFHEVEMSAINWDTA